jgi:peptidoglycan/xylan/chitin deacetylase (PgdA/CDA1 family)
MLAGAEALPERCVVLTFDDGPGATLGEGPGPRTAELAAYLADEGITATFFVCGKHLREHPAVAPRVLELGHRLGNHTYSHPHLPEIRDEQIAEELSSTLDLLEVAGAELPVPFRPPYGDWDARCAGAVNADARLREAHSVVVGWDVEAGDWEAWERGGDAGPVAAAYELAATGRGRGIVLMHDSSADAGERGTAMRAANRTLDVVTRLVPRLRAAGHVFAPLSSVLPG